MALTLMELKGAAEEWLVACTIATEVPPRAKGDWTDDMVGPAIRAVCEVVQNRADSAGFPDTPLGVVLAIKQFSGVLRGLTLGQVGHRDIWLDAVQSNWYPDHVARCLTIWRKRKELPMTVDGATHYYSPVSMIPKGKVPSWAIEMHEVSLPGVDPHFFRWFR